MLYSVIEPRIDSVFVSGTDSLLPLYGFVLQYKTRSTPNDKLHVPVHNIRHQGISDTIEWQEIYHLVPGAKHSNYCVLGQDSRSLVGFHLFLRDRKRLDLPEQYTSTRERNVGFGILEGALGTDTTSVGIFTESNLGDVLTRQLKDAFDRVGYPRFRFLDSGVYLLNLADPDEEVLLHQASIGTRTVAAFSQDNLKLNFVLADTVIGDYGLVSDISTDELRYLDENDNVVIPNFFTWL